MRLRCVWLRSYTLLYSHANSAVYTADSAAHATTHAAATAATAASAINASLIATTSIAPSCA